MTESPKLCQEPGCGLPLVLHAEVMKAPDEWAPSYTYTCPRNADAHALCAKVAAGEARERALEAKLVEAEQVVIIAESAAQDQLAMLMEARGFVSDLYAERGQDARIAHLCNQALGVMRV